MGMFFLKHNIKPRNPNDFLCKICLSPDDPHHLFFHCPFTQKLISDLEPLLTAVLKKPNTLTQGTLLFNYTNTIGAPHIITSKLASLIRLSMYNLRQCGPRLRAWRVGWSENNFFFEIEKSVVLKTCQTGKIYEKNWFWRVAIFGGLAIPQNVF